MQPFERRHYSNALDVLSQVDRNANIQIKDNIIKVKRGTAGNKTLGQLDFLEKNGYIVVYVN